VAGAETRGAESRRRVCEALRGTGGGIGPTLAGAPIMLAAAKAQIDNGGGCDAGQARFRAGRRGMLAYLETILQP
jgi:hypothetical protein